MAAGKCQKRKSISQELDAFKVKKRKSVHKKEGSHTDRKSSSGQDALDSKGCAVFSRLLDAGFLREHEIVSYLKRKDGSVMKEGQVTRDGVLCNCCGNVFLLSKFEGHAGSTAHRPSANMFLHDGRSIQQCLSQVEASDGSKQMYAVKNRERSEQVEASDGSKQMYAVKNRERLEQVDTVDNNDDVCEVCGDGGQLMLCDSCPSAFHTACIDLDSIPEGDWYCSRCRCGHCGGNGNREEARSTMLCCSQCDVHYHRDCVKDDGSHRTEGYWFCGKRCKDVFTKLRRLVGRNNFLENGLSWILLRSSEEDAGPFFMRKETITEHECKLSRALEVLQECFVPIVDYETKIDVLSQTLFNRTSKLRRLNCSGFYTIMLARGEQVVAVATVRVHGSALAEMPFLGTRHQYRQQGMCRRLMLALETMLRGIGVYRLVLPSVPDLVDTWSGAFGFRYVCLSNQKELSHLSLMSFPGTTLLEKRLVSSESLRPNDHSLNKVEIHRHGSFQASCATGNLQHLVRELHQTMGSSNSKATAASLHPPICT